jgi:hypothetical protein
MLYSLQSMPVLRRVLPWAVACAVAAGVFVFSLQVRIRVGDSIRFAEASDAHIMIPVFLVSVVGMRILLLHAAKIVLKRNITPLFSIILFGIVAFLCSSPAFLVMCYRTCDPDRVFLSGYVGFLGASLIVALPSLIAHVIRSKDAKRPLF